MRIKDFTGQRFGMLTVLERAESNGLSRWLCKCDCGNTKIVFGTNLTNGKTRSCGCAHNVHGESKTRLYAIHGRMLRTGICDEWRDYLTFKAWALENGYQEGMTTDKITRGQPYSPENCRFITKN